MYVFYALVVLGLIVIWLLLSRYFVNIGQAAEKTAKKFKGDLKAINREEEKENE